MRRSKDLLMGVLSSLLILSPSCNPGVTSKQSDVEVRRNSFVENTDSFIVFKNPFVDGYVKLESITDGFEIYQYNYTPERFDLFLNSEYKSIAIYLYNQSDSTYFSHFRDSLINHSLNPIEIKANKVIEHVSKNETLILALIDGKVFMGLFKGYRDFFFQDSVIEDVLSSISIEKSAKRKSSFEYYDFFIKENIRLAIPFRITQISCNKYDSRIKILGNNGNLHVLYFTDRENFKGVEVPPYNGVKESYHRLVDSDSSYAYKYNDASYKFSLKNKVHVFSFHRRLPSATTSFYSKNINVMLRTTKIDTFFIWNTLQTHKMILSRFSTGDIY